LPRLFGKMYRGVARPRSHHPPLRTDTVA
jgi:hypothetical protein